MGLIKLMGRMFLAGALFAGGSAGAYFYSKTENPCLAKKAVVEYYQGKAKEGSLNQEDYKSMEEVVGTLNGYLNPGNKGKTQNFAYALASLDRAYDQVASAAKKEKVPPRPGRASPLDIRCKIKQSPQGAYTVLSTGQAQLPIRKIKQGRLLIGDKGYAYQACKQDNIDTFNEFMSHYLLSDGNPLYSVLRTMAKKK